MGDGDGKENRMGNVFISEWVDSRGENIEEWENQFYN